MPVTRPLVASPAASRPDHARDPKPFGGWAMAKAAGLDRAGARGLGADLLTASTLRRHTAFVVLATVPLDEPGPFLERLGEPGTSLGDVIRIRRARDLIAASFAITPEAYASGEAFNYPHLGSGFASFAPRVMSVSRERPRQM